MRIAYFCTTWGQKRGDWDTFCRKVKEAGYDGIETSFPEREVTEFLRCLNKYELDFIGQHWETNTANFEDHKIAYSERLRSLASLRPSFINSHTGKDHFSYEQNTALLNIAANISAQTNVPIVHETHRGRFAFAVHITRQFLEHSPALKLTLDVSHWCNVAESLLQDQQDALTIALMHTRHIHARVGFEQGPQISDFNLPEFEPALQFHLDCWDKVVENHVRKGIALLPITTEFGPSPYMQGIPADTAAIKQWQLNVGMMDLLKHRYSELQ